MSTSLLYHGFGVVGYKYRRTRYVRGGIVFSIYRDTGKLRCSSCGSNLLICRGKDIRMLKTLPIGSKTVTIELEVQRVECRSCGLVRRASVDIAAERRTYTKAFERYALELSKHMTILDVARHLHVSWDVIKDIQKRYLKHRFSRPKLKNLRLIAIDEIAVRKGHKYLTIVLDLESGAVVFVGDGRGAASLKPFWKRLRRSRAKIEAVAIDMSPAYIDAVSNNLKGAVLVFDHFHVIKLYNGKLSDLRRELAREAKDKMHKEVLKGTRWLLLKNPDNLDESRNERRRLDEALQLNKPLACAYYMKEDLRLLWEQFDKDAAEKFLKDWTARALSSGIKMLMKFANTLLAHRYGILAYYDYRISTGPLEGLNNKIKTMKRQAYGFRDQEFFKLKILGLHETKYALVG